MNGWQRFCLLLLCSFIVMVCWPNFEQDGWTFIGSYILVGTGAIIVLSLISNLFAIYRFEWINRIISLAVLCLMMYVLLWYFPQTDKVSPINKMKYGEFPTQADIKQGLQRLTFNFDFVNRNVRGEENFKNQESAKQKANKQAAKEEADRKAAARKAAQKAKEVIDIVVE